MSLGLLILSGEVAELTVSGAYALKLAIEKFTAVVLSTRSAKPLSRGGRADASGRHAPWSMLHLRSRWRRELETAIRNVATADDHVGDIACGCS